MDKFKVAIRKRTFKVNTSQTIVVSDKVYKGAFETIDELMQMPAINGDYADVYETSSRWHVENGKWTDTTLPIPEDSRYLQEAETNVDALPNTIARRDSAGAINTAEPTKPSHATTKAYVDTMGETIDNKLQQEIERAQVAEDTLADAINAEQTVRKNADDGLQSNIDAEIQARENADTALSNQIDGIIGGAGTEDDSLKKLADKIAAETSRATGAEQTLQSNIDAEANARTQADNVINATLDELKSGKLDKTFTNAVLTNVTYSYNAEDDSTRMIFDVINPSSNQTTTVNVLLPKVSSTQPGLMTKEALASLTDLINRVSALEGKRYIYLYTAKPDPTADEINAFVEAQGETAPFSGVEVIVDQTKHIWRYYQNDNIGWKDEGIDTVGIATNTSLGVVQGATSKGKIGIEADGTMSLSGYDDLVNADNANAQAIADETARAQAAEEVLADSIDAHIADKSNPHAVTKEQVGLSNVANERQYSDQNPPPYPVVPNGTYDEMTVGKAVRDGEGNDIANTYTPRTFLESLYFNRTGATTATLQNQKPTTASTNYMQTTTTNTSLDFNSTTKLTLTRTLGTALKLNNSNYLRITLSFATNRNASVEFGARIKIGDVLISSDQAFGLITVNGDSAYANVNDVSFNIVFDKIVDIQEFAAGQVMTVEIFKRQVNSQSLVTRYLCGVNVSGADRNSFAGITLVSTIINTSQIADGAVTKPKLSSDVQSALDASSSHIANKNNPHSVTKAQVGLSNVADERQYSEQNPPPYPVVPDGKYDNMSVGNATFATELVSKTFAGTGGSFADTYFELCTIQPASAGKASIVFMLNGYRIDDLQRTGIVEIDVRAANDTWTYKQIKTLAGNLKYDRLHVFEDTNRVVHFYLHVQDEQFKMTILSNLTDASVSVSYPLTNGALPEGAAFGANYNYAKYNEYGDVINDTYAKIRALTNTIVKVASGETTPETVLKSDTAFADTNVLETWGGDFDEYIYSGHFVIRSNSTNPALHVPIDGDSTATNGIWHLLVFRYTPEFVNQIAMDVRGKGGQNNLQWRAKDPSGWSDWKVIPQDIAGTYEQMIVGKANALSVVNNNEAVIGKGFNDDNGRLLINYGPDRGILKQIDVYEFMNGFVAGALSRLRFADPTKDDEGATKGWADKTYAQQSGSYGALIAGGVLVQNSDESNIAHGYSKDDGTYAINYRGASKPITDTWLCQGMGNAGQYSALRVAEPSRADHAATKNYVDNAVANAGTGKLPESLSEAIRFGYSSNESPSAPQYYKFASATLVAWGSIGARIEFIDFNHANEDTMPCGVELIIRANATDINMCTPVLLYGSIAFLKSIYAIYNGLTIDLYYEANKAYSEMSCKILYQANRSNNYSLTLASANPSPITELPAGTKVLLSDNIRTADAYIKTLATTDWTGSATPYSYTITATTHCRGQYPNVLTYVDNEQTYDSPKVADNGDVTIYSNAKTAMKVVIK